MLQIRNIRRPGAGVVLVVLMGAGLLSAGEIEDLYRKFVRPRERDQSRQNARFERLNEPRHGVTEVGLERTACFGTCPEYWVVIKADGTFRYEGKKNVQRTGTKTGRLPDWQFHQLSEFLVESGYMDLEPTYEAGITDLPATYTTAVVHGKRKVIRNYGDLGPVKLWALQQVIDSVLIGAEWDGEEKLKPGSADDQNRRP